MAATRFFEINEAGAYQSTDVNASFDYTQIARLSARTICTQCTHQILMDVIHIKTEFSGVYDTLFTYFSGRCAHQVYPSGVHASFNLRF